MICIKAPQDTKLEVPDPEEVHDVLLQFKARVRLRKAIYENLAKIIRRLLQYSSTLQTF